jgi:hypothetical protein
MKPLWISTAYDEEQPMNKEDESSFVTGGLFVIDGGMSL